MSKTINMASSAKNSNAEATVKKVRYSKNYVNEYLGLPKQEIQKAMKALNAEILVLDPITNPDETVKWVELNKQFDKCVEAYSAQDCGDYWFVFAAKAYLGDCKIKTYKVKKTSLQVIENRVISFMEKAREEASRELDGYNGEVIFKPLSELNDYLGFNLLEQDEKTQYYVNTIIKNNYEICEMFIINEAA